MNELNDALKHFRHFWHDAPLSIKIDFCWWSAGIIMMALAIIWQFKLPGALFCLGFIIWKTMDR